MDILLQHALLAKPRSYLNGILLQAKPDLVLNLLCKAARAAFGTEDTYEVTVYRNEDLLNTDYTLTLSLDAVENCLVGPAEYKHVTIQVTDRISQPVWWNQSSAANLGTYSDMKYRVFIIFMDGEILESLDKYTGIEFVNLIADFKAWWKDQWQQGNYQYYDTDGVTPLYETILDN